MDDLPENASRYQEHEIIEFIWNELLKEPFDLKRLARGIIWECGVDAKELTPCDMEDLFEGCFQGQWGDIAFAFDETLACHSIVVDRQVQTHQETTSLRRLLDLLTPRWMNSTQPVASAHPPLSGEGFVRAVFMSLYLSEAIKRGEGDWEWSFDKILNVAATNMDKGDFDFRMNFLSKCLDGASFPLCPE